MIYSGPTKKAVNYFARMHGTNVETIPNFSPISFLLDMAEHTKESYGEFCIPFGIYLNICNALGVTIDEWSFVLHI